MLGLLQLDGYRLVSEPAGADFVVVNTCGFIERAREESYATIHEMLELKRKGDIRGVIVSGCLAEREKEKLLETLPEIDHLVGVFGREQVTKVADRLIGGLDEQRAVFQPAPSRPLDDRQRLRITPRHFAYLKISEGCDRLCTFCAIPKMRGKHATKPMEEVRGRSPRAGGRRRARAGDRGPGHDLLRPGPVRRGRGWPSCSRELEQVEGLDWIRLMYLYPMYFNDELIERIAGSPKIIPYLDLPLQHINDTMLKRMQRRVDRQATEELLTKLRERIDDLVLRTTFITGFPGETDEQFDELVEFVAAAAVRAAGRVHLFARARHAGGPARRPPERGSQSRAARPADGGAAGNRLCLERGPAGPPAGRARRSAVPGEKNAWIGRSYADAPDVDGVVYVTGHGLRPGKLVDCEIVATSEYDLVGVAIGKPR